MSSHDFAARPLEQPMRVGEIRERLDRLVEHGFITAWHEEHGRWLVDCSVDWGWYSKTQVSAFIDGCNAMGAAP